MTSISTTVTSGEQAARSFAARRHGAFIDGAFDALDGADVDLLLAGPVPLIDGDGDGIVEALGRIGPNAARPGLWTGELRASPGVAPFSAIWLGVPKP